MFKLSLLVVSSLVLTSIDALQYRDCGKGQVKSISVDSCDPEQEICTLTKGKPFNVELDFIPEEDAESVTFHLSSLVFGFAVELPVDDNDACKQNFIECPVKKGVPTKFKYQGNVDESVPVSSVTVVFNLKSDGNDIACVEADLELQDPVPEELGKEKEEEKTHQEL